MKAFRIVAAFIVLVTAGTISYFFFENKSPTVSLITPDDNKTGNNSLNSVLDAQNSSRWIESLGKSLLGGEENFAASSSDIMSSGEKTDSTNLTQQLASLIFEKMKNSDQQGENPFEDINVNGPQSQELIQDAVDNMSLPLDSVKPPQESELNISSDNSQEAQRIYLEKAQEILKRNFDNSQYQSITEDNLLNSVQQDCFSPGAQSLNKDLANQYRALVNDYLALAVPASLSDVHKEIVFYFRKMIFIHQSLAECFDDPIKGYLAIETLPQLIEDGQKIQEILNQLINT